MIIRVHIFLGNFYFDLEADLTELFHWNNKQLFIYIMGKGPLSTVFHFFCCLVIRTIHGFISNQDVAPFE